MSPPLWVTCALADYNHALKINPRLANAYNNRGNVWRDKGQLQQAISDFDKAIELEPRLALAYASRGLVRLAQGKCVEAEQDFARSLQVDANLRSFIKKALGS